ncbi:unnamed protein product [Thelazia callipaeda]|uniref:Uncharacterized protein n=1 Tax=Thelazia callipaeda TaxID=103827 RepID=A0A0N5D139_THECL|nr:unnamed protein product [Thelazia callipaeda]
MESTKDMVLFLALSFYLVLISVVICASVVICQCIRNRRKKNQNGTVGQNLEEVVIVEREVCSEKENPKGSPLEQDEKQESFCSNHKLPIENENIFAMNYCKEEESSPNLELISKIASSNESLPSPEYSNIPYTSAYGMRRIGKKDTNISSPTSKSLEQKSDEDLKRLEESSKGDSSHSSISEEKVAKVSKGDH